MTSENRKDRLRIVGEAIRKSRQPCLGDFKPSLRNTHGNTWEARIGLPVVGYVTTEGNGWEEAKMRLWLVSEAVKLLAAQQCNDPRDWTEAEWRSTLQTMRDVLKQNAEVSEGGTRDSRIETAAQSRPSLH